MLDARAIILSFDNLGEASELERGTWDHRVALGHHESVTVALPRLLDELDALGLSATFFVEAFNCELYPQALLEIADRRHELAEHSAHSGSIRTRSGHPAASPPWRRDRCCASSVTAGGRPRPVRKSDAAARR
jgi:hypothetical protein